MDTCGYSAILSRIGLAGLLALARSPAFLHPQFAPSLPHSPSHDFRDPRKLQKTRKTRRGDIPPKTSFCSTSHHTLLSRPDSSRQTTTSSSQHLEKNHLLLKVRFPRGEGGCDSVWLPPSITKQGHSDTLTLYRIAATNASSDLPSRALGELGQFPPIRIKFNGLPGVRSFRSRAQGTSHSTPASPGSEKLPLPTIQPHSGRPRRRWISPKRHHCRSYSTNDFCVDKGCPNASILPH